MYGAATMHAVAKQAQAVFATEPVEERDKRLNAALQDATHDLGRAIAGLVLEPGVQPLLDDLIELRGAFSGYTWEIGQIERDPAGRPEARKRAIELLGVIEAKAKAIEQRAREHLTS